MMCATEVQVSRLWKSELRLELRTNVCYAVLHSSGLHRRVLASASASGRGASAISAALAALRMADIDLLAADARLTVADEYIDFALLPGHLSAGAAHRRAKEQFSAALGHEELMVHTLPMPGHRGWLAAAIDLSDFDAWTEALMNEGVSLRHIHPALTEDLRTLSERISEDDAVVVLLREEGATLMRLEDGVPSALVWERFDASNHAAMETRLRRFSQRTSERADGATVVYMLPQSKALCRYVLDAGQAPSSTAVLQRTRAASSTLNTWPGSPIGVAGLTQVPEMVVSRQTAAKSGATVVPLRAPQAVARRPEQAQTRHFLDTMPGAILQAEGALA